LDEKRSFSATDAVDWLKSESKVEKTSYGTVQENAGDHDAQRLGGITGSKPLGSVGSRVKDHDPVPSLNDTVPVSLWRGRSMTVLSAVALIVCLWPPCVMGQAIYILNFSSCRLF